jgi:hypothetical protein
MCGTNNAQALAYLTQLELLTQPLPGEGAVKWPSP